MVEGAEQKEEGINVNVVVLFAGCGGLQELWGCELLMPLVFL